MRILITNDDGIIAPGLATLEHIAGQLAGPDGEVWVVAPATEQSGVGHCISYTKPMFLHQAGPRRFAVEGTPADCVLAGLFEIMVAAPPDLVLSGVNRGNNISENTLYSGTIGATIEAALHGVRAIAMSQFFGPENAKADDPFEAAKIHGAGIARTLLDKGLWQDRDYGTFYNVNFPPVPAASVKGTQVTTQGSRPDCRFRVEPRTAPNGRRYLWSHTGPQQVKSAPGSDAHANLEGYVSVTPMRADLTAHEVISPLRAAFDGT